MTDTKTLATAAKTYAQAVSNLEAAEIFASAPNSFAYLTISGGVWELNRLLRDELAQYWQQCLKAVLERMRRDAAIAKQELDAAQSRHIATKIVTLDTKGK